MRGTVTSSPAIFIIIIIIVALHFGSRTKAARHERPVREIATDILTYKVSLVHGWRRIRVGWSTECSFRHAQINSCQGVPLLYASSLHRFVGIPGYYFFFSSKKKIFKRNNKRLFILKWLILWTDISVLNNNLLDISAVDYRICISKVT